MPAEASGMIDIVQELGTSASALIFFVLHLILLMGALITLVYELAVSFEALTEHLDVMRDWKNKF